MSFYKIIVIFWFSFGGFIFSLNDLNELLILHILTLLHHICCKYFKEDYFLQLLSFSFWIQVPECLSLNLYEMSREIPGVSSRPYARSSGAHMSETMWLILPCLCRHMRVPLIWWADRQLGEDVLVAGKDCLANLDILEGKRWQQRFPF